MRLDKKQLQLMFDELEAGKRIYRPSGFWETLGQKHEGLINLDLKNFKRTVNANYFNWGILGILGHQLRPVISEVTSGNFGLFLNGKLDIYRIYVSSLYEYVAKADKLALLKRLKEPKLGNPLLVSYKERRISQDLCNSVHEFYSITDNVKLKEKASIVELGAGYGRLAFVFLAALPKISYTIVDIPPALYVAQEYLSRVFPKEKIFYFRHFKNFREVSREFQSARIRFLTANQIELLPEREFDVAITISSLHEMTRGQIENYLKQFGRVAQGGYFYIKQWRKSRVADNDYITEDEYPIPKKWKAIFMRQHPIQRMFFEALYRIG